MWYNINAAKGKFEIEKRKGEIAMLYAAYGSNTNLEQMKCRCPNSKRIGVSEIRNYKLVFDTHLDIRPAKGETVPVVLWEIAPEDWEALDFYEGYPLYYIKKEIAIKFEGKKETVIAYVMNGRTGHNQPTQSYLQICLQGYKDNGLNSAPLCRALWEA